PKCFRILQRLRKECEIAVWHDDQQGTATINVAGLINALKVVGKKMPDVAVTLIGAGASNIRTAKLLIAAGARPEHIILVDSRGIVCRHREDIEVAANDYAEKWELALKTNGGDREGGIGEAMRDADVAIAASKPGPGVIQKNWVASMADDAILFVIANPVPEIWPWEAAEAGARVIATGRSDFPNQVNNSLGFPGIFRGTLDVRARTITDEMCIAAAEELAKVAEEKGLDETHIVPTMDGMDAFEEPRMARVKTVKRKHEARLMSMPGVVGVGIGRKEGRDCICIYVKDDDPRILAALPRALEEIPVEVIVSGPFTTR